MPVLTQGVKFLLVLHVLGWAVTPLLGDAFAAGIVLDPDAVIHGFQLWRLATFPLLVGSAMGLVWTAVGLVFLAPAVERRLGTRSFLGLYLASSITAGVLLVAASPLLGGRAGLLAGPSAAQWGILAAFARMFPTQPILAALVLPVRAVHLLGLLVLLRFMQMWDVQQPIWPSLFELGGVAVGWFWPGGLARALQDLNPLERYRNWKFRRAAQRFKVVQGGKRDDPSRWVQ